LWLVLFLNKKPRGSHQPEAIAKVNRTPWQVKVFFKPAGVKYRRVFDAGAG
jgi:hypothetical protein